MARRRQTAGLAVLLLDYFIFFYKMNVKKIEIESKTMLDRPEARPRAQASHCLAGSLLSSLFSSFGYLIKKRDKKEGARRWL